MRSSAYRRWSFIIVHPFPSLNLNSRYLHLLVVDRVGGMVPTYPILLGTYRTSTSYTAQYRRRDLKKQFLGSKVVELL